MKKITQAEFLNRAYNKHGGKYDYSQVVYSTSTSDIKIICAVHGVFEQPPKRHIKAAEACLKCAAAARGAGRRLSQQDFLEKARQMHGSRYDYSKVILRTAKEKITVTCSIHGDFEQIAGEHIIGKGCAQCARRMVGRLHAKTTEEFEIRARKTHGNYYDYSKSIYTKGKSKVKIICPKHGLFEQAAAEHMSGKGCSQCAKRQAIDWVAQTKGRPCTLYFIRLFNKSESFFKVGITIHSVKDRFSRRGALADYQYELLASHISTNAVAVFDWEQSILTTFSHLAYTPNQHFVGATECFSSADEILAIFPL